MRELCERLDDPPEFSPALYGQWVLYLVRGELRKAYELAEQLLRRAQRLSNRTLLLFAEYALGAVSFWMGDFLPAGEHLKIAISLYDDPTRNVPLTLLYGEADAGVYCLCYAAWTLWQLGYPDQALERGNEAVTLAHRLSHPLSTIVAGHYLSIVHQFRRERYAAQEKAERVIRLSAEHGFTDWLAWATSLRGWALAMGHHEVGIGQIRANLAALQVTGAEAARPYFLCLLAEAYMETGRFDDGLRPLTEALAAADEHNNHFYEAETHRLKSELLLRRDNPDASEIQRCLQRAIGIARMQRSKSWELRATTSLARLLATQGRLREAHEMLANIYDWFTEGFDTADLKDANTLLAELSRKVSTQ